MGIFILYGPQVTFKPDLAKFKMKELDDDIISFMCRYGSL